MTDRQHFSPTQIDLFARCGEAYRRRYIEGEIIPPAIAMLRGRAVDTAANVNFAQKIDTHEDLPADDLVDQAVANFETETASGYSLDPDDEGRGAAAAIHDAVGEVVSGTAVYAGEIAPQYQPEIVQGSFRIDLPGPRDLVGILDMADDHARVVDLKTARRKKRQDDADTSTQLTAYYAGYMRMTGRPPTDLRLETAVLTKTPSRQLLSTSRDMQHLEGLAARINVIGAAVDAGLFPPAPPGAWWCSRRWCGYWHTCIYAQRGILKQGD